jgi:hypothetical protein
MELKSKILLVGSIVFTLGGLFIASGIINVQRVPALHVVLPVGVLMAGIFLIIRLFEKESKVAVDDQQKALKDAGIDLPRDETPAKQGSILSK